MKKKQIEKETKEEKKMKELGNLVTTWWNGGGRLVSRIEVNPELRVYLATKPDIFVYGD